MPLSDQKVLRLATLARLSLSPEERGRLAGELEAVLDYFGQLSELDTRGVSELVRPVPLANVTRDDGPLPSLSQEEALGLANETEEGFFKVPRTAPSEG